MCLLHSRSPFPLSHRVMLTSRWSRHSFLLSSRLSLGLHLKRTESETLRVELSPVGLTNPPSESETQ